MGFHGVRVGLAVLVPWWDDAVYKFGAPAFGEFCELFLFDLTLALVKSRVDFAPRTFANLDPKFGETLTTL